MGGGGGSIDGGGGGGGGVSASAISGVSLDGLDEMLMPLDEHLLADIVIRADALSGAHRAFEDEPVSVELTVNGQQFSANNVPYTYLAPSRVWCLLRRSS